MGLEMFGKLGYEDYIRLEIENSKTSARKNNFKSSFIILIDNYSVKRP